MKATLDFLIRKRWLILSLVLALVLFLAIFRDTRTLDEQLMLAIRRADLAKVKTLLDRGADVNAKDAEGHTPLTYAVRVGVPHANPDLIRLLLDKGADINLGNKRGVTALIYTACMGKRQW